MLAKKYRTIDEYMMAGAGMRLFKELGTHVLVESSKVLSAADQDKFSRSLSRIDEVCCHAEDNMFSDFPELGSEYTDVFYGNVSSSPRGEVDKAQMERAKQVADELFK